MVLVRMKNKRLLFVCGCGRIFRSLAKMKRLRTCPDVKCKCVVPDNRSARTMQEARRKALAIPSADSLTQKFVNGKLILTKKAA